MRTTLTLAAALFISACCTARAPSGVAPVTEPEPEPKAIGPIEARQGGQSVEDAFPPERLARVGYDIVVVTIVASDKRSGTTNGRPPEVVVRVEEVLAGKVAPGERRGLWAAPPSGIDWSGESARQARAEWEARPLPAPEAGVRLIALGREVDGVYRISAKLRSPYSDDERAKWVERIQKAPGGTE